MQKIFDPIFAKQRIDTVSFIGCVENDWFPLHIIEKEWFINYIIKKRADHWTSFYKNEVPANVVFQSLAVKNFLCFAADLCLKNDMKKIQKAGSEWFYSYCSISNKLKEVIVASPQRSDGANAAPFFDAEKITNFFRKPHLSGLCKKEELPILGEILANHWNQRFQSMPTSQMIGE